MKKLLCKWYGLSTIIVTQIYWEIIKNNTEVKNIMFTTEDIITLFAGSWYVFGLGIGVVTICWFMLGVLIELLTLLSNLRGGN